jgi:cytochrome c556
MLRLLNERRTADKGGAMDGSSRGVLTVCMLAVFSIVTTAAWAQDDEAIIGYRQKVMEANGANMGAIGDILKFNLPYQDDIAGHARAININSKMIAEAFKKPVSAGKTDAKPEIWKKWDEYKADADKLTEASEELTKVADGGDRGAIVARVKKVGEACKNCHESFRKPKEQSYKRKK